MDVVSESQTANTASEDLRFRVPAVAARLQQLRRALRTWASHVGLATETVHDLVLAAYEAMANVVDHAYRGRLGGFMDLHAHSDPAHRTVTVTVTDYGRWRPPSQGDTSRGRGLRLIRGLAEHVKVTPSQHGTTVAMVYRMA